MQCSARKTHTHEPCQAYAIKGGEVCVYHGGSAPQVREAANRRLRLLADDALEVLRRIVTDNDLDPRVKLQAAKDILDRLGIAEPTQVEVTTITLEDVQERIRHLRADGDA